MHLTSKQIRNFHEKYIPDDGCWEWLASKIRGGYGQFKVGTMQKAHRVSWIIYNGQIPDGLLVLHKCDNPGCVNPNHLFLGSYQDNMDDMKSKGRDSRTRGASGEDHSSAKLTEKKVLKIRRLKSEGITTAKLSSTFKVSSVQINAIVRRQYWNHI